MLTMFLLVLLLYHICLYVMLTMFLVLGADNAADIANIMSNYGKNLDDTMNKHRNNRTRQTDELHRKLAMRRQAREQDLREKQKKEVR